jgi:hypothetical protein
MEWSTIPRVFQRNLGCKRESLTNSTEPSAHVGSSFTDFYTLKMEVIHSSKTSVHTRSTWHHIPEYNILHGHCCENLKTYKELTCSVIKISSFYQTPQSRFLPPFCLIMETSSFQNVVIFKTFDSELSPKSLSNPKCYTLSSEPFRTGLIFTSGIPDHLDEHLHFYPSWFFNLIFLVLCNLLILSSSGFSYF